MQQCWGGKRNCSSVILSSEILPAGRGLHREAGLEARRGGQHEAAPGCPQGETSIEGEQGTQPQPEPTPMPQNVHITRNDALAVPHEIDAMTSRVGHSDTQQLPVGERVPHPDVLLGTGSEEIGGAAAKEPP